ncbi:monocarboxylate transporter 13-like isoform X2 [Petromyzon marinus]
MEAYQQAPDGGWGWLIVLAAFVQVSLVFGVVRSVGVFFIEFTEYFQESSTAISWITSIALCVHQFASPIASTLSNQFGSRSVVIVGGISACIGFLCASFAHCLLHLYLSLGLLTGFGWAMVFSPSISTLSKYFDKRRSLALGIAFSGVGMSSFAFSPLFQMLVETYTWRGALMILAGLELNLCVCGALLRPIRLREDDLFQTENAAKHRSLTTLKKLHALLDLDLLKHRGFMVFTLSFTFINTGFFIPYVHLLAHLQMLGFSSLSGAFVISAVAVADIVARLFSGWLADLRRIPMVHLFFFWTLTTGIIIVIIPFGQTYTDMIVIGIVYGFASGAMAPIGVSLLSKIVGIARITSAIGFLMLLESVGSLLGPPISGFLKDYTGDYTMSFIASGLVIILGCLVLPMLEIFFSCSTSMDVAMDKQHQGTENEDESPVSGEVKQPLGRLSAERCDQHEVTNGADLPPGVMSSQVICETPSPATHVCVVRYERVTQACRAW